MKKLEREEERERKCGDGGLVDRKEEDEESERAKDEEITIFYYFGFPFVYRIFWSIFMCFGVDEDG